MRRALTAAVIGIGFMGKTHIEVFKDLVEELIICSNDEKTCRELGKSYGCRYYVNYEEMFEKEKIDIVSVCLPTSLHFAAVTSALKRGISVLCEKPFASSESEANEMLKLSKESGALLMVAHCLRFTKPCEYLKRCVRDGRFGKLKQLKTYRESVRSDWSVGNWLNNYTASGGVVRDLNVHNTDLIVGVLGAPRRVYTVGGNTVSHTIYDYGTDVAVSSSASWRDIDGVPYENGYDAVFEKAWIKNYDSEVTLYTDGKVEPLPSCEEFSEEFSGNAYENEIKYFCNCVADKTAPALCPPEESLLTMKVNDLEGESMRAHLEMR